MPSVISNAMTLSSVCATAVMMRDPPGLPVAIHGLPSLNTSVGVMEDSGRLPADTALASP